jgi:hypothetical protein
VTENKELSAHADLRGSIRSWGSGLTFREKLDLPSRHIEVDIGGLRVGDVGNKLVAECRTAYGSYVDNLGLEFFENQKERVALELAQIAVTSSGFWELLGNSAPADGCGVSPGI